MQYLVIYYISISVIIVLVALALKNPNFVLAGIILWLLPFILQNKFRKPFSKRAAIRFDDNGIFIQVSKFGGDVIEKTDDNLFADISSFRVMDSSKDDSSFLRLIFKDGTSKKYTFLGQGKSDSKQDVSELTFEYVNNYNDKQDAYNKIQFTPNLFATKLGQILITLLTILVIVSLIVQISKKPKTIPFTILTSLAFYFIIIAQRKKDIEQMGKMR
jgi:hypothetical protein